MASLKTTFLIALTLGFCTPLLAGTQVAPPASDYDYKPEYLFTAEEVIADPSADVSPALSAASWVSVANPLLKSCPDCDPKPAEVVRFQFDASKYLDWSALMDLNHMAVEAWKALLTCSGGDAQKARGLYLAGTFCSAAESSMKNFSQSIALFLSSTMVNAFEPKQFLQCQGFEVCPGDLTSHFIMGWGLLTGYNPNDAVQMRSDFARDVKEYLDHLPTQDFHPLLIQAILENMAAGYPIFYGGFSCGGTRCALDLVSGQSRTKMVMSSDDLDWSLRGAEQNETDRQKRIFGLKWLDALATGKPLPVVSEAEASDGRLILLRKAMIASRLLAYMSVGKLNFANWGLWPKSTDLLISIFAQSRYWAGGADYPNQELKLLAMRLSDASKTPIRNWVIAPGSTDKSGHGPIATAFVGGWRTLYNRHQK